MWLFERFVSWNYEFLSVTYIGSELLLLLVYWMMQDYVHKNEVPSPVIVEEKAPIIIVDNMTRAEKKKRFLPRSPRIPFSPQGRWIFSKEYSTTRAEKKFRLLTKSISDTR